MNAIAPLGLGSIEQQMEERVQGQYNEYDRRFTRKNRDRGREDQTTHKGCLHHAVQTQLKRIDTRHHCADDSLDNPWKIGNDDPQCYPLQIRILNQKAGKRPLQSEMSKCVRHGCQPNDFMSHSI